MSKDLMVQWLRDEVEKAPDPEWIDIIWEKYYKSLRECLLNKDPNHFLRWKPILQTMHSGGVGKKSVKEYYETFRNHPEQYIWVEAAKESPIGDPVYFLKDKRFSLTSIRHAVHLQRFQDATSLQIVDMDYILEFGGGYGSMRRIIDRLSFEGDYVMYDMPLLAALQKYYLGMLEIPTSINSQFGALQHDTQLFIPERSLFIATSSLSEAPLEIRHLIKYLVRDFKGILISYSQNMSDRVDNNAYFKESWISKMPHHTWHVIPIKENRNESYYLFGVMSD